MGTTTRLAVTPGRAIEARWKWLEGDEFASRVKNAFEQGVLRGASVGFVPKDSEQNRHGKKRSGPGASSEAMNPYAAVFGSAEEGAVMVEGEDVRPVAGQQSVRSPGLRWMR